MKKEGRSDNTKGKDDYASMVEEEYPCGVLIVKSEGESSLIVGCWIRGAHITCARGESGLAHIKLSKEDRFTWGTIQCVRLLALATCA